MTVYVDALVVWPNAWGPFKGGSCHMFADADEELHELAARIGMKRSWFQNHRALPHYDLTPAKRLLAIAAGAVERSAREHMLKRRGERTR